MSEVIATLLGANRACDLADVAAKPGPELPSFQICKGLNLIAFSENGH
jgi:hypothetical protein